MILLVTFEKECRDKLNALGDVVFEDAAFIKDFIILDTKESIDTIRAIDGVTSVDKERTFSVNV